MLTRRLLIRLLLLLAALVFVAVLFHRAGIIRQRIEVAPRQDASGRPANIAAVSRGDLAETIRCLGVVRSRRVVSVAALIPGQIIDLRVREGDRVKSGEVLLRLDPRERRALSEALAGELAAAKERLRAALARVAASRASSTRFAADFTREENLSARGVTTRARLDAARERGDSTRAAVEAAEGEAAAAARTVEALSARNAAGELQEEYTEVRSPMDAIVSVRHREPGDVVGIGQPLLELLDERDLVLSSELTEEDLPKIHTGARLIADGIPAPLKVDRILPRVSARRMVIVEADFVNSPDAPLRPGQTMPLLLEVNRIEGTLLVPRTALAETEAGVAVCVPSPGGGHRVVPVTVLGRDGVHVAVMSANLNEGDSVLVGAWLQWLRESLATGAPAATLTTESAPAPGQGKP